MENANRMISFIGIKPPRPLQKAVEKQLEKWVERKKNLLSLHKESWYQVRFAQENNQNLYQCSVRVQIGACKWEGAGVGKTLEEALFLALKSPMITFVNPEAHVLYHNPAERILGIA
jgi:hypothetical protein